MASEMIITVKAGISRLFRGTNHLCLFHVCKAFHIPILPQLLYGFKSSVYPEYKLLCLNMYSGISPLGLTRLKFIVQCHGSQLRPVH